MFGTAVVGMDDVELVSGAQLITGETGCSISLADSLGACIFLPMLPPQQLLCCQALVSRRGATSLPLKRSALWLAGGASRVPEATRADEAGVFDLLVEVLKFM
jgi:hypothetical protein